MSGTINEEVFDEQTISKVNFILSQKEEDETPDDFLLKYTLKIIFKKEPNSDKIAFLIFQMKQKTFLLNSLNY
jgi:hypothetical protein